MTSTSRGSYNIYSEQLTANGCICHWSVVWLELNVLECFKLLLLFWFSRILIIDRILTRFGQCSLHFSIVLGCVDEHVEFVIRTSSLSSSACVNSKV